LLGSNDAVLEDIDPRGLSVEQYVTNLTDILTKFMNDGIAANQLILLTPPAISEVMYEKRCREMGKQPYDSIMLIKKAILKYGIFTTTLVRCNTEFGSSLILVRMNREIKSPISPRVNIKFVLKPKCIISFCIEMGGGGDLKIIFHFN